MQERLLREHPLWVAAVYWNPQEEPYETLRDELKRIRETGFTAVRFHAFDPAESRDGTLDFRYPDQRFHAAHEVGLKVFPHLRLRSPIGAALAAAGLSAEDAAQLGLTDPRVVEAVRMRIRQVVGRYRTHPALLGWPVLGEPGPTSLPLTSDQDRLCFLAWLRDRYPQPADVHRAWLIYPNPGPAVDGHEQQKTVRRIASWDDALAMASAISRSNDGTALATTGMKHEVFGAMRDLVRFRADGMIAQARTEAALIREVDPDHPVLVGCHQLFYNNPQLGWDTFETARTGDLHFSSIHLSWHFEHVFGEVDRPVYMQARMTRDAFKGGATSAYETTGGPVQYSGGYGHHMDAGLMRRLVLSYLAAGNQVLAFWDWRCRPGGLEAGEYALTTLSGKVTPWAREIGRIAAGMERCIEEIWKLRAEPELGILRCWDTEMVLSLEPNRFGSPDEGPSLYSRGPAHQHMRALIGASRAAINEQVSFEYLTDRELLAGIAGVYPTLYLPHVRGCSEAVLESLLAYVESGGRLIADVQFAFSDPWGKLRPRGERTLLTRLFGGWVDSIHHARTCPQRIGGVPVEGFYGDIELAGARTVKRFADGRPAVTEAVVGQGRGILLAFDAGRCCWRPGNTRVERLLGGLYRGPFGRKWKTDAPIAVRRAGETADHWFLINDGARRRATIEVFDRRYVAVEDMVEGTKRPVRGRIRVDLPAYSALWLRCRKPNGA
jgi:beta-galactosidase GanA